MSQELEEVQAPLYAWRSFRITETTNNYRTEWSLRPLFNRPIGSLATNRINTGDMEYNLLDWNTAHQAPEIADEESLPGFHCFHGYGQAITYAEHARAFSPIFINDIVIARIELGGTVVEHELGYRAERLRITHLEHPNPNTETRNNLATSLGWPFPIAHCDLLAQPRPPHKSANTPTNTSPHTKLQAINQLNAKLQAINQPTDTKLDNYINQIINTPKASFRNITGP